MKADGRRTAWMRQAPGFRSALALLLVLAAFLGQSIVTQSHVHFADESVQVAAAATSHGQSATTSKHRRGESPADCPLCRELALSGHYLMPAPVVLPELLALTVGLFLLPVMALAWRGRSHSWRSRAPPR